MQLNRSVTKKKKKKQNQIFRAVGHPAPILIGVPGEEKRKRKEENAKEENAKKRVANTRKNAEQNAEQNAEKDKL